MYENDTSPHERAGSEQFHITIQNPERYYNSGRNAMNAIYLSQELLHLTNKEVMQSNHPETKWRKQDYTMSFFINFRTSTEENQNGLTASKCA